LVIDLPSELSVPAHVTLPTVHEIRFPSIVPCTVPL
jgi:hypothetical protein